MEAKGYEIKNAEFGENSRKYITFRSPDMSRPVRGSAKSLGKNFTKERIKERIENKRQKAIFPSVHNKLRQMCIKIPKSLKRYCSFCS